MVDLLSFLKIVLPEEGVKCWVTIKNKAVRQNFTGTLEKLAAAIQEASRVPGYDIYHACATFDAEKIVAAQAHNAAVRSTGKGVKQKERSTENAAWCKAFWLDIDCGERKPYADADAAIVAVDEFANKLGIPLPLIVRSGRGIHAYWILIEPVAAAQWTETARLFKLATEILGLHADPSRTADVSSILRPPGTSNYKREPAEAVTVEEGEPVETISFADFTARIRQHTGTTPVYSPAVSPTSSSRLDTSVNILGGLKGPPDFTKGYPDGHRTQALAARAGHLLGTGHSYEDTLAQCLAWNQHNTPPLPDEKLVHDISSYAKREAEKQKAAAAWQEPLPLMTKSSSASYPLEALPDKIRDAVKEAQAFIQAPVAMVASSALAALSLAAQSLIDVKRAEKLTGPASLFFLTVADSGERKSSCDSFFMSAIRDYEKEKAEQAKPDRAAYQAKLKAWESKRAGLCDAIRKKAGKEGDTKELEQKLTELEREKPEPPKVPRLTYSDATPEALTWSLAKIWPSGGIVSSEAGIVFGAHGMNKETIMRNLSALNILWDGGTYHSDRKTTDSFCLHGARLTIALQVQGATLQNFFDSSKGLARGSGFLARFLVSCPESTQGNRPFRESPSAWPCLAAFHKRIAAILAMSAPITPDGGLSPAAMQFTTEAKAHWIKFHDTIESTLSAGGQFHDVRDVASKITDNAARMAGLFQVFETGGGAISLQNMKAACEIVVWHLEEARRFFGEIALPVEIMNAKKLESWLLSFCRQRQTNAIPLRHIRQYGPVRDKVALEAGLRELHELGRAQAVQDGKRKDVQVNPALLTGSP